MNAQCMLVSFSSEEFSASLLLAVSCLTVIVAIHFARSLTHRLTHHPPFFPHSPRDGRIRSLLIFFSLYRAYKPS